MQRIRPVRAVFEGEHLMSLLAMYAQLLVTGSIQALQILASDFGVFVPSNIDSINFFE
jgi:hypothetical protein